jgi:hypothetical protein
MFDFTQFVVYLLLGYILLIALHYVTPVLPQKIRFFVNATLLYLLLLVAVVYGLILSLALRVIGRNGLSLWSSCRFYVWMMTTATGISVVIEGLEYLNSRPGVLIMNHQTYVSDLGHHLGSLMNLRR